MNLVCIAKIQRDVDAILLLVAVKDLRRVDKKEVLVLRIGARSASGACP